MSLVKFIFSKSFFKQVIYSVIFISILLVGLWLYLSFFTRHNEKIIVPNIKGLTVTQAKEKLEEKDLNFAVIDSIWNQKAIGGTIMEQIPDPGSEVKEGREIYLTVYRLEAEAKSIDIKEGEDAQVAQIKLENKGLNYSLKFEQNTLLAGRVIRILVGDREITSKDKLTPGQKITLVVGEKGYSTVNVPDLSGQSLQAAIKTLHQSNLSIGLPFYDEVVITKQDTFEAKVYQQSKTPGLEIKSGSLIDLWLSTVNLSEPKP